MNRSYFGTQAVLKRLANVKDIWANVIYEGDTFDIELSVVAKHLKNTKQLLLIEITKYLEPTASSKKSMVKKFSLQ